MVRLSEIFNKSRIRILSAFLAVLLALPLSWGALTGIYIWLSPFVMLNSVFVLKSLVWLNSLAFIVLVITIFRKRWFCRILCPVGLGCDYVSSKSLNKKFSLKKVPPIGKWLALSSLVAALFGLPLFILLDPLSIFNGFFVIFSKEMTVISIISFLGLPLLLLIHLFFPNIWCAKLCPLGGLQDEVFLLKRLFVKITENKSNAVSPSKNGRRIFLATGAGLIAGLVVPRFLRAERKSYFRPPASLPQSLFNVLCLRCGSCIKACPTKILKHRQDANDPTSWMVPEMTFRNGYCIETCNQCGVVCPSGSITLFSVDAKKEIPIGLAEVELSDCLLIKNKECDKCKSVCAYDAVSYQKLEDTLLTKPIIDGKKCVGCGACAVVCPEATIRMIPL